MTERILRARSRRRGRFVAVGISAMLGVNALVAVPFARGEIQSHEVNSHSYEAKYGHWDTVELPKSLRVNAIHATLLDTGKILITAGSGNDADTFRAGTFKTLLYDPTTGQAKLIDTPTDMFCGGQAELNGGRVLIAGGTQNYEVLKGTVTNAGGVVTIQNENPDSAPSIISKNSELVSTTTGQKYRIDEAVVLEPAYKSVDGTKVTITPSSTQVWMNAEDPGPAAVFTGQQHFTITGLVGDQTHDVFGLANTATLDQHDFEGTSFSYEFDPKTEQYARVASLTTPRWYPTLTPLSDGQVLAVSGLDGTGEIVTGAQETEEYNPVTQWWSARPDLTQYFPTYPALFETKNAGILFYSGSNAGYGPAEQGRTPGLWNVDTNAFTPVPGLRDPGMTETSGSAWVGPVQDQKVAIVGGGGVGDSDKSTSRIDIVDLNAANPHYEPGPSLPQGTRYPNLVTLPDDTTLITGGSSAYRGDHDSDNRTALLYHPATNTLSKAASPSIGRDYHSEALLLPDGRVITMGSNPNFADKHDTEPGVFEQRLEIYSPPYLYQGDRPEVSTVPQSVTRGGTFTVKATGITTARLIRPGAATHVTDVEQRSVALDLVHTADGVSASVPTDAAIVPDGWYMVFFVDASGVPSVAQWVQVTG